MSWPIIQTGLATNPADSDTFTVTLSDGEVTPGDGIGLCVSDWVDARLVTDVTSPGATWNMVKQLSNPNGKFATGTTLDHWYAEDCSGGSGSDVITITLAGATAIGNCRAEAFEIAGMALSGALDTSGSNTNQTGVGGIGAPPTITIADDNEFVLVMFSESVEGHQPAMPSPTWAPLALFNTESNNDPLAYYGVFPAGSLTAEITLNGATDNYASLIAAYKPLPNQPGYDNTVTAGDTEIVLASFVGSPDAYVTYKIDGSVVASGSLDTNYLTFTGSGWAPGWTISCFSASGTAVDSSQLTSLRSGIGSFPSPPAVGTAPNAGYGTAVYSDSYLHGFTALGYQRYSIYSAASPTAQDSTEGTIGGTITGITAEIALEQGAAGYLNTSYQDSARPRHAVVAFPNDLHTVSGYATGVAEVVTALGPGTTPNVTYFEGLNEPEGSNALTPAQSAAQWNAFAPAVHSGNASAKAIGPAEVAFSPTGSNTDFNPKIADFVTFLANITTPLDGVSVHDYNAYNGDFNITDAWLQALWTALENAGYTFGSIPLFFTEVGAIGTNWAIFDPRRVIQWAASLYLTLERWGCPKENTYWFYDTSHGYAANPSWIKQAPGDLRPEAVFFRVYSEEIWGKTYNSALNFGVGNTFYRGNVYTGSGGKTVALLAQGNPSDTVTLGISDTGTITVSDWEGNLSTVTELGGQIVVPVGDLPVYVRLSADCTITVVDAGSGLSGAPTDLALAATVTSGSGAATPALVNDGIFQTNGYLAGPDTIFVSTTQPDNLVLTWENPQIISKVVVRHLPPWINGQAAAMTAGKLEYWNGSAWLGCPTVARANWDGAGNYSNASAQSFLGQIQGDDNGLGTSEWIFTFYDNNWNHNVIFSEAITTTQLRLTVSATSFGQVPDEFGYEHTTGFGFGPRMMVSEIMAFGTSIPPPPPSGYTPFDDPDVLFDDFGTYFDGGSVPVTLGNIFTPPLVRDRPPYLPDSDPTQTGLWRHFENRLRGVNVFKCTNAAGEISYVQDTATLENRNTNIPYPWDPNNPSGPYVYVTNWDGTVTTVSHPVWIVTAYYGGHSYPVSPAEAALLVAAGYGSCLT